MVKKIGKKIYFIISLLGSVTLFAAPLELSVTDMNGHTVQQLTVGVPYTFEIKAEGTQNLQNILIPGIESLHHEFRGATRISMMSRITTQHTYQIRADKVGTYVLGPVQIINNKGHKIISNTLTVIVTQQQQQDVIVQLSTEVNEAVIGEKIPLTIRLNTRIPTELISLEQPKLEPDIGMLSPLQQTDRGTITINNTLYEYAEWHADLIIKQPGELLIPPLCAICKMIKKERPQDFFSSIMSRFNTETKPQHYFSNELVIKIDPLPAYNGHVDAIGIFNNFQANLNIEKAYVGEGIVLTLLLESKTNPEQLKTPSLLLPDGLKYYESKTINEDTPSLYKKSFEYIIQGMKSGNYEIPEQSFTFFNTETRTYQTLKTIPITVTVLPNKTIPSQQQGENIQHLEHYESSDSEILPLQVSGAWLFRKERSLSWFWFFMALLLPFIYSCSYFAFALVKEYKKNHYYYFLKKNAFKLARKQIKNLNNDATLHLYDIFMNMFANRFQLPLSDLTSDVIECKLRQIGFSQEIVEQWHRFFYRLEEQMFLLKNKKLIDAELINRAQMWVVQLEEKL